MPAMSKQNKFKPVSAPLPSAVDADSIIEFCKDYERNKKVALTSDPAISMIECVDAELFAVLKDGHPDECANDPAFLKYITSLTSFSSTQAALRALASVTLEVGDLEACNGPFNELMQYHIAFQRVLKRLAGQRIQDLHLI